MSRPIRLFNLDLHISVIADVKAIVEDLYGPSVEIVNWSISGHNWVFGAGTPEVDVVNQRTWMNIGPEMVAAFQTRYDSFLSQFDGFIVTHTPVFCMLYEKYGKPILLVNSCRYEQPYSWTGRTDLWKWLDSGLHRLQSSGLLVAVSNNKADREYLLRGAGVESILLPSLCLYTGVSHVPRRNEAVVFGRREFFPPCASLVAKPERYDWADLYSYKAIVHIPYEMSTMSLFEQYSAGVPLFLPSRAFYRTCIANGSMPFGSVYSRNLPSAVLDAVVPAAARAAHDRACPDFWLDRADFYDAENFKYVYFYDSPEDLVAKIQVFEDPDRAARMEWIHARKDRVREAWRELLFRRLLGALPLTRLLAI